MTSRNTEIWRFLVFIQGYNCFFIQLLHIKLLVLTVSVSNYEFIK